ncbi:choice-of-anchor J domain-containing protein [Flavobacterium sp. SUN052]|nr:choice-of-anchor J domain-containing protein [Flavobacterium sp. SUN052]
MNSYTFTQALSSTAYAPMAGVTTPAFTAPWDNQAPVQVPIGFNFNFDSTVFTQCFISPNGFITFGSTAPSATLTTPIADPTVYNPGQTGGVACAMGADLISAGSDIVYGVEGTSPTRTFIVQWSNVNRKSGATTIAGVLNFQIRLFESTNVIQYFYGTPSGLAATNVTVQAGLRGYDNVATQGNIASRIQSSTSLWLSSNIAGLLTSTLNTNSGAYPNPNLQFTYTPGLPCAVPAPPTSLILGAAGINSNSINGNSFTAPSPVASRYLVLMSLTNVAPTAAQFLNRTYYIAGNTYFGFKVLSTSTTTTFPATSLATSKTYYFWIVPYNDLCVGGPVYNLTNVLTGTATTCFPTTTAGAATLIGGNQFNANWSAVAGSTNYVLDVSTNNTFTAMVPGYSGLSIPNTVTTFAVTGLLPATTYYYRVRAIGPGCIINSLIITVTTTCGYYTIPYTQNFDTTATGTVPSCYSVLNTNADSKQWSTQSVNFASASKSIQIDASTVDMNDWFFVPGLNLTGGVSYRLTFKYNTGNTSNTSENLRVSYGSTQSVAGMSNVLIDLIGIDNSFYTTATVDFTPVSSGVYYIGFQGSSIANQEYIVVDDISVDLSPTCVQPSGVNITSITSTTASLNWTPSIPAPALGYDYYLSTSNVNPTLATTPTGSVAAGVLTKAMTGLSSSTYYYVWVRSNCSAVDKSSWTLAESFNTECSTPTILSSTPATRCGFGVLSLAATSNSGSFIRWYDSATGGTLLNTGTSFITPSLSSTTTYYIEAKSFGAIAKVGEVSPVSEMGVLGVQNYNSSSNVTISSPTILQTLDIYPIASGQPGRITVRNSSNVTLTTINFTTSVSGGATAQQITINYNFVPGDYNLYFDLVPTSGVRNNVTSANYPYTSSVATITGNNISGDYYLGFYNLKFTTECLSSRVPVTASVTIPPSLSLSATDVTICEDYGTNPIFVNGYASYSTFTWSPNTNISGSFATGFVFSPTTTTTYTLVANQASSGLCGNVVVIRVNVNAAPPPITINTTSTNICYDSIQALNGSTSLTAPSVVINENFNAATNNWTVANTSTVGNVLDSQWTLHPSGYVYSSAFWNAVTFSSNDASQFYLANSDSQSAGSGSVTRTTLTSPLFTLAGYTSANLSFWHFLRFTNLDSFLLQISTNGGASWTTLQSFTSDQGAPLSFVNFNYNLNAYVGMPNLQIRFNYTAPWTYGWAVDNFTINGTLSVALTWAPPTGLYTNAAATIPYTTGTPLNVVYAKPTATTTYTATITASNSCNRTNSVTITVSPATATGVLSSSQTICNASTPSSLSIVGYVGSIVRWEYADDAAFSINVNPIANTTATLTAAQMGVFPTIRYFRAVIKSGICNQLYSNVVYVSYPITIWNGTSWSNGIPTSGVRAVFNGSYSSTSDLYACSVVVNLGTVTFNSGHSLVVDNEVVVSGGSLVFENNASLVQINNTVNSGTIVYKRNTMPVRKFDFTYWSSPVSGQTFSAFSPLTLSDKYLRFDPVVANWASESPSNTMLAGKGYIIRAPNNFDPVTTAIFNASFIGVPNNGNFTTPILVSTSSLNLIGNPYPSALSADLFLSDPANTGIVDGTIYLWTHNTAITANQYSPNDYAVYNYLGGTGTSAAPSGGANTNVPNGKIAAGQSFFIKGLSSGIATYKNSMRIVGNNNQFFRLNTAHVSQEPEKHRVWLEVSNQQGAYKQTLIGYAADATLGVDRGFDGAYFNTGSPVALYSIIDATTTFAIQGRPLPFDDSDEVPLGFYANASGNFTINLFDYDGLFANQTIYLKDKVLNLYHNLKNSSYNFSSNAGTFNDRFVLVYRETYLNTNQSIINSDAIVLYKPNADLQINAGTIIMNEVKVFDVRGRLLFDKKDINATTTQINLGTTNEVLLIEITTSDSIKINKKYIN